MTLINPLISYERALELVLTHLPAPHPERVDLQSALGRILATDVYADLQVPPFDKSIMDGFALRSADVPAVPFVLDLAGDIPAGTVFDRPLEAGEAARIMTGAPLPAGADAVQQVEKTRLLSETKIEILEKVTPGQFVSPAGCEVRQGALVVQAGQVLGPAHIGTLAIFGKARVDVFRTLNAAVISTGSELVEISERPGPGQIRNSNGPMLIAQSHNLGLRASLFPHLPDDRKATERLIESASSLDVLIFSGGVSAGEWDLVHQVMKEMDATIVFHGAAVKPGKPILFARRGRQMIFGLPGNPVSSFVTFELFVRPAVRRVMGFVGAELPKLSARVTKDVTQKPGRRFFKPARLRFGADGAIVKPVETKGSADLAAFAAANALIIVPPETSHIPKDSSVDVILLEQFVLEGRR